MGETTVALDEDAIRRRAYELSLDAPDATPEENWDRARRELEAELAVAYDTNDLRLQPLELTPTRVAANGDFRLDPGVLRLHAMLGEQRDALLTHEAGVRIGADPENLHQHRVAARRARAFLRATRHLTSTVWRQPLNERLRALGAVTGPVRDFDVLIEYVDTQGPTLSDDDRPGVERLRARLQAEREAHREALLVALAGDEYRTLVEALGLAPQLAEGVESIPLDDIAAGEFRRLLKAIRRLGEQPSDAELHALRITVKRARYAAELAGRGDPAREGFLQQARKLQTLLGDHQDASVAEAQLRAAGAATGDPGAAFAAGLLAERQHARRARVTQQLPGAWRRLRKLQASGS